MPEITIREFEPRDAEAFRLLNEEWIERYFRIEPKDRETLGEPQRMILDKGGRIFIAEQDGAAVGCCALIAMEAGEYELAKMAVAQPMRRAGIGRRLIAAALAWADSSGANRIYLETNSALAGAVALYTAMGFERVPPERLTPSVYARANVFMERML
jgi:N-acetylglutamate synthase-like GNAT family acetyltransferase